MDETIIIRKLEQRTDEKGRLVKDFLLLEEHLPSYERPYYEKLKGIYTMSSTCFLCGRLIMDMCPQYFCIHGNSCRFCSANAYKKAYESRTETLQEVYQEAKKEEDISTEEDGGED